MSEIVTFYVYATGLTYIVLCLAFWWRENVQQKKLTDATIEVAHLQDELTRAWADRRELEVVLGDAIRVIKGFEKERVVMVDVTKPKQ